MLFAVVGVIAALLVLAFVITAGTPGRAVKLALEGPSQHLVRETVETAGRPERVQYRVVVKGADATRLREAMPRTRNATAPMLLDALVVSCVGTALRRHGRDGQDGDPRAAVEKELGESGLALEKLELQASLKLDKGNRRLAEWYIANCKDATGAVSDYINGVSALDFYLDGLSGEGTWVVTCPRKSGDLARRVSDTAVAREPDEYLLEVTRSSTSSPTFGNERLSLEQMRRAPAPRR